MKKLGINLDAFENIEYDESAKILADLGFKATFSDISFGKAPEYVAELCNRFSLEYQFVHAIYKGANNMWLNNINGDGMFQTLISNIDSCHNANVPILVIHISSGFTPPPISKIGKERFRKLVARAQNKKVKIAFENLRVPKYLKWAMETFKDCENVGFCWDTGHENCFTKGIEYMSLYGDRLLCTHIHDNNKELGRDLHLIPFDGKIDYNKVACHLKNSSYEGPLMLEVFEKNEIYNTMSGLEFYKKAYNSIRKIQQLILD